ncbi:MAG: biotin--[acetyl-CoA-carboxylase] ligase [Caldimicrobium sp.]
MLEEKILKLLKKAHFTLSGETIARELKISRVSVWKNIKKLKEKGYPIKTTKKGYFLESKDIFLKDELEGLLKKSAFFKKIYLYPEVSSTMDVARSLVERKENAVILAERQTSGRGRLGRTWESPQGGLWLTLLLFNPPLDLKEAYLLTYLSAVATAKAIKETFNLPAKVKWPNDVLLYGKKVAGILLEIKAEVDLLEYALIGIGVNVNNAVGEKNFMLPAISIKEALGKEVERRPLLENLLINFENLLSKKEEILKLWKDLSETLGKEVKVITPSKTYVGLALDLDEEGRLILETKGEEIVRISSGDCLHLRN